MFVNEGSQPYGTISLCPRATLHTLPAFQGQTHVIFVQSYGDIEKSDVTSTQKNNQKGLYKDDGRW